MRQVLALHCMLAAGAAWRGVQATLPGAAFACPDLPGHGGAPDWDGGAYMDQALELALEAAPEGSFDLLGHSYGGCLALRLLVEHPERVRSLTLVEPVMFAAAPRAMQARQDALMGEYARALDAGDRDGAARIFTGLWGSGRPWGTVPERQRTDIRDRIHLVAASGPGIVDDVHGILDRLPGQGPPTSIVVRREPPEIVAGIARGLSDRMPGAGMERLGQGHMIPLTDPAALADHLCRVWDGVDPTP